MVDPGVISGDNLRQEAFTFFITSLQSVSGDCILPSCVNVSAFTAPFEHGPDLCCVASKLQDLLLENIQGVPEYFVSLSFVDAVFSCWPHLQTQRILLWLESFTQNILCSVDYSMLSTSLVVQSICSKRISVDWV